MTNDELPEITPLTDEEVAEIEAAYNPEMKMSPESDRRNRRWLGMLLDNQRLTAENAKLRAELAEVKDKLIEALDMLGNIHDLCDLPIEYEGDVAAVLAKNDAL